MISQSIKLATMPLGFPYNDINDEVLKNIKETQKRAKTTYYDVTVHQVSHYATRFHT